MRNLAPSPLLLALFLLLINVCQHAAVAAAGGTSQACDVETLNTAKATVNDFLSKLDEGIYKVMGWRWHTMAVAREARLLSILAEQKTEGLSDVVDYLVDFNMKGLHGVESNIFYPWVKERIGMVKDESVRKALMVILDDIIFDQTIATRIGASLVSSAKAAAESSSADEIESAKSSVAAHAKELAGACAALVEKQGTYLVPFIAKTVPTKEQDVFNFKVLKGMGFLDSRLYVVSMHEAVAEMGDAEMELFKQRIPSFVRAFIGRWKRNLYIPRAGILATATKKQ